MKPQERLVDSFLAGAHEGMEGRLKIVGEEILSFSWYPVARRVDEGILVRRQMYSEQTALHIKTVKRVLDASGYRMVGNVDEPDKVYWWLYRRDADES